jgi:hypothetical protein
VQTQAVQRNERREACVWTAIGVLGAAPAVVAIAAAGTVTAGLGLAAFFAASIVGASGVMAWSEDKPLVTGTLDVLATVGSEVARNVRVCFTGTSL